MKEKDVHNLIEQQNPEAKQRMWKKISSELDLPPAAQPKSVAKKSVWKWAVAAFAVIVVVTLSVVLSLTLKDESPRYCDVTQYVTADLGQTLGEYIAEQDKDFLCVDWYDTADEINTVYGYNKKDKNDIFYFSETILNGETGESITISITDNKTRVDVLEQFDNINETYVVCGVTVNWQSFNAENLLAKFEYKGYIYYLQLDDSNQARLTEIISDMLN